MAKNDKTRAPLQQSQDYLSSFIISRCMGIIETWRNHSAPLPLEEIAALCGKLLSQHAIS